VLSNVVSLTMFFGVFGAIFILTQYLQGPLDLPVLSAGIRTLPWTGMPMLLAPISGLLAVRLGSGRLMALGLAILAGALAWLALVADIYVPYARLVPPFALAGVGMGLVLAPTVLAVLGSVDEHEHGKASGANNTLREVGGALGVAVAATVFGHPYDGVRVVTPLQGFQLFVRGMTAVLWVTVAVLAAGALAALFVPRDVRPRLSARRTTPSEVTAIAGAGGSPERDDATGYVAATQRRAGSDG
jgi:MFS family permease